MFVGTAGVVVAAGSFLARFGDELADRTGLGGLWMGAVLVALVTSLPELVTDVSAVRQGSIDLAAGDLFGSSMSNMAILGLAGAVFRSRRLLQSVALENILTATLAIALTSVVVLFISMRTDIGVASLGLGPVVIALIYLGGVALFRERHVAAAASVEALAVSGSLLPTLGGFLLCAAAILAAGPFLAMSAGAIAEDTGLGETFFGTLALAFVTSLPELVVSISALRIGALDLAIANLLGSNATNMALLLPLDIAYTDGRLLSDVNPVAITPAVAAIVLMAVAVTAVVLKAERRRAPIDPASALLLVVYALGMVAVYDVSR